MPLKSLILLNNIFLKKNKKMNKFKIIFLLLIIPFLSFAQAKIGKVNKPYDGDSGRFTPQWKGEDGDSLPEIRYRLIGVDTPEKSNGIVSKQQFWADSASLFVAKLIKNQSVTVEFYGMDQYGRAVCQMFLADGTDVSAVILKNGWGWYVVDKRLDKQTRKQYNGFSSSAKRWKKGLFKHENQVSPASWRELYTR